MTPKIRWRGKLSPFLLTMFVYTGSGSKSSATQNMLTVMLSLIVSNYQRSTLLKKKRKNDEHRDFFNDVNNVNLYYFWEGISGAEFYMGVNSLIYWDTSSLLVIKQQYKFYNRLGQLVLGVFFVFMEGDRRNCCVLSFSQFYPMWNLQLWKALV